MPFVHIWSAADCTFRLVWRTAAAARRLKLLTLAAVLSCGGATPPPAPHVPPSPPIATAPSASPWKFEYLPAPPSFPIPLTPALPRPGERWEAMEPVVVPDIVPVAVATRADAPGSIAWFGAGAVILFLWKAMKWA